MIFLRIFPLYSQVTLPSDSQPTIVSIVYHLEWTQNIASKKSKFFLCHNVETTAKESVRYVFPLADLETKQLLRKPSIAT